MIILELYSASTILMRIQQTLGDAKGNRRVEGTGRKASSTT